MQVPAAIRLCPRDPSTSSFCGKAPEPLGCHSAGVPNGCASFSRAPGVGYLSVLYYGTVLHIPYSKQNFKTIYCRGGQILMRWWGDEGCRPAAASVGEVYATFGFKVLYGRLFGWEVPLRLRTKLAVPGLLTARHGMIEVQCNAARWDVLRRTSSTGTDGGESEGSFSRRGCLQSGMLHVRGGICDAKCRRRACAGGEMQPLRRTKMLSVYLIRALRSI